MIRQSGVLGLLSATWNGNTELAAFYLNTSVRGAGCRGFGSAK